MTHFKFMSVLRRIGLALLFLVIAVGGLFLFIVFFSEVKSPFVCNGVLKEDGESKSAEVFIEISEFRWWVGLWGDEDGWIWVEKPKAIYENYRFRDYGHVLHIYAPIYDRIEINERSIGGFTKLSKTLTLETAVGYFDGRCTRIEGPQI